MADPKDKFDLFTTTWKKKDFANISVEDKSPEQALKALKSFVDRYL